MTRLSCATKTSLWPASVGSTRPDTLCAVEQPTQQTIYSLFNGRLQFQVPVYQRAYVWNEDKNWGLLWDDIADTANRYLDDPEAHLRHRHFLGPIVLSQQPSPPSGIDPRLVIDGQQRLTTLQIIIAAASAAARDHGAEGIATDLADLTANRGEEIEGDDCYKVWPSRRDREAFLATIDNGADEDAASGIAGAWRYFRNQIEVWITDDGDASTEQQTERMRALKTCLERLLYVVAINLDETDNAQVIFETLNARGTGLGALDLIKNAVFLQAQRQKAPADQLHDREWEPTFENDDYWLEETRQGREKRARADWFLMHWLAMELGQIVRADKLFDTFRKDVLHSADPPAMTSLVPRLCADAEIMRSFDDFDPATPEGLFLLAARNARYDNNAAGRSLPVPNARGHRGTSACRPRCARELAGASHDSATVAQELQPHTREPSQSLAPGPGTRRRDHRRGTALVRGRHGALAFRRRRSQSSGRQKHLQLHPP
jgi:hypothetical protein